MRPGRNSAPPIESCRRSTCMLPSPRAEAARHAGLERHRPADSRTIPTKACVEASMKMRRRDFLGTAAAAGASLVAAPNLSAQEEGRPAAKTPTFAPKIELLYKSPDRYPNALEAAPDGLWVGDQVSER